MAVGAITQQTNPQQTIPQQTSFRQTKQGTLSDTARPGRTIDAVITWVDGSDAEWRKRRKMAAREDNMSRNVIHNTEGRFRDNNDLRFLLRSLEQFWRIDGVVYLVTEGHLPSWLNLDHPRLRVVKHHQFMPREVLPTFSSRAIESCIHRISGLSDHYVVFNDDFFLTRNVFPDDFFDDEGRVIVYREKWQARLDGEQPIGGGLFYRHAKKPPLLPNNSRRMGRVRRFLQVRRPCAIFFQARRRVAHVMCCVTTIFSCRPLPIFANTDCPTLPGLS